MLGVPYQYVTGYRSSAPARLALQRGEIKHVSRNRHRAIAPWSSRNW